MSIDGLLRKISQHQRVSMLLVWPRMLGETYWNGGFALPFINKKATMPPLGPLTIAGMFPDYFDITLKDMNVEDLTEEEVARCDVLGISSMDVYGASRQQVIELGEKYDKVILLGGPSATHGYSSIITKTGIFVMNEGELTIPLLVNDLEHGVLKKVYARPHSMEKVEQIKRFFAGQPMDVEVGVRPDLALTPPIRYDLIPDLDVYMDMTMQLSRGCPHQCTFCDVVQLDGNVTRYAPAESIFMNLNTLYEMGWRGTIFLADDNTGGNPRIGRERMESIQQWQDAHGHPFTLSSEISVNATDAAFLNAYVAAGGKAGFIGLETPNVKSLAECGKWINLAEIMRRHKLTKQDILNLSEEDERRYSRELMEHFIERVHSIQRAGVEVSLGLIVGFDNDPAETFDRQIELVQRAGIPSAMVGLLNAGQGTTLYDNLEREGRIISNSCGDNTHKFTTNFVTRMDPKVLSEGYKRVLTTLYGIHLEHYFKRSNVYLDHLGQQPSASSHIGWNEIGAALKSSRLLFQPMGWEFAKFMARNVIKHPTQVHEIFRLAITGYHYQRITEDKVLEADLDGYVAEREQHFVQQAYAVVEDIRLRMQPHLEQLQAYGTGVQNFLQVEREMLVASIQQLQKDAALSILTSYDRMKEDASAYFQQKTGRYQRIMRDKFQQRMAQLSEKKAEIEKSLHDLSLLEVNLSLVQYS